MRLTLLVNPFHSMDEEFLSPQPIMFLPKSFDIPPEEECECLLTRGGVDDAFSFLSVECKHQKAGAPTQTTKERNQTNILSGNNQIIKYKKIVRIFSN